jgi:hypothetical protein
MRHEMPIPEWFQRELRLINENYFCIWNPQRWEFQIRRWLSKHWKPTTIAECFKVSKIVHTIPYPNLDERALYGLRVGLYNARIVERILHEVDEANALVETKADAENDYQHKAAAKDMWRHYKEPRVFINRN